MVNHLLSTLLIMVVISPRKTGYIDYSSPCFSGGTSFYKS